jgi:hypothetical protein
MMLSKVEMEDIWNNKPVGYLKDLMKRNKKSSLFKVAVQPYERKLHDLHEVEVRAKNRDDAIAFAQKESRSKYTDKKIDGWIIKGVTKI